MSTPSLEVPDGPRFIKVRIPRRLWLLAACIVYAYVLNWSYSHVESKLFAYQGFIYDAPDITYMILGYFLALLPVVWLPMRVDRPSQAALILFYITLYVPMVFVPLNYIRTAPGVVLAVLVSVLCFWLLRFVTLVKLPRIKPPRVSNALFQVVLLISCVGLTLMVGALNGFKVDLSVDIGYARRLAARDTVAGVAFVGYAITWLGCCFAPLSIAYGLAVGRKLLVIVGCIGLMAIFSFTGAKTSMATALMMIGLFLLLRRFPAAYGLALVAAFAALVGFSAYRFVSSGDPVLSEMVTRRVIASKGTSFVHYWQFFKDQPVYMRDSNFNALLGLPREKEKTFRVGEAIMSNDQDNYNANAWATAFGDFGYAGMFLASIVIGLLLRLIDNFAYYGNRDIHCLAASFLASIWGEQGFATSLLTSGVVITIAMLYLLSGTTDISKKRPSAHPGLEGVD